MGIEVVVMPVAGLGTLLLPATKAVPKEMLPVMHKPLIQRAVEEAHRAGVRHVVLVTSAAKRAIEDHFDAHAELEQTLARRQRTALLEEVRTTLPPGMTLSTVRQSAPLGLGHAVLCAEAVVAGRPFAVMLPDDFIDDPDRPGCLVDMMDAYRRDGAYRIAVAEVPRERTGRYGIVSTGDDGRIIGLVEKPSPDLAPSTLAVVGRYLLPAAIFDALRDAAPGAGGEIQLTDGIAALLADHAFQPHRFHGVRYDCGSNLGYLQANIALALRDPEIGETLSAWLRRLQETR